MTDIREQKCSELREEEAQRKIIPREENLVLDRKWCIP
jgi:hypothetical protein